MFFIIYIDSRMTYTLNSCSFFLALWKCSRRDFLVSRWCLLQCSVRCSWVPPFLSWKSMSSLQTFCGRSIDIESTPLELTGGKLEHYNKTHNALPDSGSKEAILEVRFVTNGIPCLWYFLYYCWKLWNVLVNLLNWLISLEYKTHRSRQWNCWSLRCSWSIACRRCSNYIFILDLTSGFKGFGRESRKTLRESFKCWDFVWLILEN